MLVFIAVENKMKRRVYGADLFRIHARDPSEDSKQRVTKGLLIIKENLHFDSEQ